MNRHVYFAYPGDIATKSGGYGYDRRVMSELQTLGWNVDLVPLGNGFPFPAESTLHEAETTLSALPQQALVLIDGLAFGVFGEIAGRLSRRHKLVALVHHPLALEGGLPEEMRARLERSEKQALAYAQAIIVTSATTRSQLVKTYQVPESKIMVAVPGTDTGTRAHGNPEIMQIISIGSVIPRKGHDVLVAALSRIADLPWKCRIIGSLTMDSGCATELEQQIARSGLADRIELTGQVDDTRNELARSDIFALASRYEGYGMVFAEALSHGLPIVACRAGAIPEVVAEDAGMLVAPDDPDAFAEALRRLIEDRQLRGSMANASFLRGTMLPRWAQTAQHVSTVLEKVRDERI